MTSSVTCITVQKGEEVYARGRNGSFKPVNIDVINYDDSKSILVESNRKGHTPPIMLSLLNGDAGKLAAALLGIDVAKLYRYQEVVTDGEAEYGNTQYVEAESIEEAFELAMQFLVFNYNNGEEAISYKGFLVDGREDTIELPGDYRYLGVESLRKFELADIVSEIRSNRIDQYPIPRPDTD
ncbi:MAG: hypothetical protein JW762_06430 [Dehalococcoidales bacterium]|nr:hypothetical protein [Dehalococcoidales bacterium]